jgi:GAF domain-containing protein
MVRREFPVTYRSAASDQMKPDSSPGELMTVFAGLYGMLLTEQDATAAVRQLAWAAHQMVPTSAGAGVSLMDDDGTRLTAASTDDLVGRADAIQYSMGQGPCISAWATGETQRVDDTTGDARWLRWQGAAAAAGIRSVISVPLRHRDRSLGALKVYATTPGAFGDDDGRLLQLLAEAMAVLMGAAQPADAPVRLSEALKAALHSRETIALASGVLMSRDGLGVEDARLALLELARSAGRPVVDVAAEVLDGEKHRRENRGR